MGPSKTGVPPESSLTVLGHPGGPAMPLKPHPPAPCLTSCPVLPPPRGRLPLEGLLGLPNKHSEPPVHFAVHISETYFSTEWLITKKMAVSRTWDFTGHSVLHLATRPETPSTFTVARRFAAGGGTYVPSDQSERLHDNSQSPVLPEPAIAPLQTTKSET